ncbi:molybdopterin-dependent oxidoreductase [Shewanella pneumatophori]|uniref:Molybdopterin-dependent oxidoreductase n=1 Tax=Shewanella pneumatophori TaxID=314092 RepID=A0A9X2CDD7_9GAMM|nr:molybdopterin-dependent oxidoreductase [Shewanella pneumatophori]MCL1137852.1 molybdopterin-dependent oxidoreductase [Shewanella pneumatophori]
MAISRRHFLKASLASAFAAQGLTLFPASKVFADDTQVIHHASHYGPFKAVVKNGKLIGIQPINDIDEFPTEMLTKGVLGRTYSDTRVMYPMVRKSFYDNPLGDHKPHLRGKEPFVRVDWKTAIALTSYAIAKTIQEHGNEAIFSSSYGGWSHSGLMRPQTLQGRFFNLIGGQSSCSGDYSAGASEVILPHIIGDLEVYSPQTAWEVIGKNTQVFIFVGCDPFKTNRIEFTVADHQMHQHWLAFAKKGIKFISINPQKTYSDAHLGSDVIHIRPGTDTALFTAMSYHLYNSKQHDQAFLDKYTVGFDKYLAYLDGTEDGVKKTPEWAAAITGLSKAQIIELAEIMVIKRTQIAAGWALQRADHGEMIHWAIINFSAMAGKIGKPGVGCGFSWHYGCGGMPQSGMRMPIGLSQGRNPVTKTVPVVLISDMLNNPGKAFSRDGSPKTFPDTKLIYNSGNNLMSHQQNTNELIKALEKVDTVICQDPWWCASSRYADIVLPSTTTLERNDMSSGGTYSNNKIYAMKQVIEPVGESLDDYEIFSRLAFMFNVHDQYTGGKTMMEHLRHSYENSDGPDDFDTFWNKGISHLATPKAADAYIRHAEFYQDPNKHPLHTPSGKIELYSSTVDSFNIADCPGMPKWMPPFEWLGNAKEGQVQVLSPHPWMRLHSQMANTEVNSHESVTGRQIAMINATDAKVRDVKDGDIIEVYNERGTTLCGAKINSDCMPGVIYIHEGAWLQLDAKGRCNSGSINMLTSSKPCSGLSQATSANTCLAYFKKCTDPLSENLAYTPPAIITAKNAIDIWSLQLGTRLKAVSGNKKGTQSKGETLFYGSCSLCHASPHPDEYTINQWKGITKSMFPRSGLNAADQKLVLEFLDKHAKK